MSARKISVVIPLFNEKESLPELYRQLVEELRHHSSDFELVFVDDGSRDGSSQVLKGLHKSDPRVRIIRLRRNFGKSAALSAGFRRVGGDVVITIDADLQDRPHEIRKLLAKLDEGVDLVSGWRYRRKDNWRKRLASKIYNMVTAKMTGLGIHDINCGFKAYRRRVIEEIRVYGEMHRYIPVLASYRGFVVGEVEVEHSKRRYGRSKYGISRMLSGFFDFLTVVILTRYSSKPLHIFGILGGLLSFLGSLILAYLTAGWLMGEYIEGRPLFFVAILMLIIGVQFFFFGLLAEMIAYSSRREEDYSIAEILESEAGSDSQPQAVGGSLSRRS
ncbi:MAG TPA: glycosyltransferase family 2 protein [Acidobacteriota bacterium]|nr:glycosyltransferase family 2 protein [Acidobacteriota bacterium]